jgi:alpha-mannosidase
MESIPREALARNEAPFVLSFFPSGQGELPLPGVRLSDDVTQMGAFKLAEDGQGYILRLFEPTGEARRVTVSIPAIGLEETVPLGGFEIASYRVDPESATLTPVDLIERPL